MRIVGGIKEGAVTLTDLSTPQIAAMLGVSVSYIGAALKTSPARRELVRRGLKPLIEPPAKATPLQRLGRLVAELGGTDAVLELLAEADRTSPEFSTDLESPREQRRHFFAPYGLRSRRQA
jgi:hypothetical protein